MNLQPVDEKQIHLFLVEFPEWKREDNKLCRSFNFENFRRAFAFLTELSLLAEQKNHHPEIVHLYKRVELRLWTIDLNGITPKDIELARAIERVVYFYESRASAV